MSTADLFPDLQGSVESGSDLGIWLSLSSLASEFGAARETVRKRLEASGVQSSRARGGHPLYRLRDALAAWQNAPESGFDPDRLDPFRRKAFYQSEHEKLTLQAARGELVPRIEVEQEQARTAKLVAQFFDTLPDVLERDCGASPLQLAKIEDALDRVREGLYRELVREVDQPITAIGVSQ